MHPEAFAPQEWLSHPSGLRNVSFGDRDASLSAHLQAKGCVARPFDDPPRFLHDEAQRHDRNDSGDLARLLDASSLRALEQTQGYQQIFEELEEMLAEITGFDAVSLLPNAAARANMPELLAIPSIIMKRAARGIAISASSLSRRTAPIPASAVMAGMQVVVVACDERGNVDLADLKAKGECQREEFLPR